LELTGLVPIKLFEQGSLFLDHSVSGGLGSNMNPENPEEEEAGKYHQPGCLGKSELVELVEAVAESMKIPRHEAARIVDVIFDSIVGALRSGDRIDLRGFGTFAIRQRRGRKGRNPKTGDPVAVPPKKVAFFSLSRTLARTLNRS
jgi:integration host factor subunit beta